MLYGVRGAGKKGPQRDRGDTLRELGVFPRGTLPAPDFRGCKKRTEQREAEEEGRTSSAGSRHLQRSGGPSCHPALPWVAWITMWEAVFTPHSWVLSGGSAIREVLLNGDVNVQKHLIVKPGKQLLMASCGWRSEILLNVLQSTGQNHLVLSVNCGDGEKAHTVTVSHPPSNWTF